MYFLLQLQLGFCLDDSNFYKKFYKMILLIGGTWDGTWQNLKIAVLNLPKREKASSYEPVIKTPMVPVKIKKDVYLLESLNVLNDTLYFYRHERLTIMECLIKLFKRYAKHEEERFYDAN